MNYDREILTENKLILVINCSFKMLTDHFELSILFNIENVLMSAVLN